MKHCVAVVVVALSLPAAGGCGGNGVSHVPFEVRDSSGILIAVTYPIHANPLDTISLGLEPVTVISGPFFEIRGVDVLEDGGLVTADGFADEIRVYSLAGHITRRIGGEGDGPSEFRSPSLIRDMASPNKFYAYDRRNWRVLRVDPASGTLTPLGSLEEARRVVGGLAPIGAANGRLIFQSNDIDESEFMTRRPGTFSFTQRVWSIAAETGDQVLVSEHEVPFVHRVEGNGMAWNIPYAPRIAATSLPSGTAIISPGTAEVRLYNHAGKLTRIFRINLQRSPVDAAALEDWNAALDHTEGGAASPDSVPFFDRVTFDDKNRLWARRYQYRLDAQSEWLLFAADGRMSGVAVVPPGVELKAIRDGYAAGVIKDAFGQERVVVYKLSEDGSDQPG